METYNNYNNYAIKLLISPRFRVLRHLILLIFVLIISANSVWHMVDEGIIQGFAEKYSKLFFFAFLLWGGSSFNIYVLTPKLLLKNKLGLYFGSLSIMVVLIFVIIVSMQIAGSINEDISTVSSFHLFRGIIGTLSSSFSFMLLFAGSSTLVLFKRWILDMEQSKELESATLKLELKLLENQINPHFLFNMLNNANIMIKKDPDVALHIIGKLEEMLRYLMNESMHDKVYLKDEVTFLNDYLDLEKTRRDYFNYTISVEGNVEKIQIPPLLFISFVENAVKHNQDSRTTSYVHILFKIKGGQLIFICENSVPQKCENKQIGGIGLANIERRLNLLYKDDHSLQQTKADTNYKVKLEMKL